MAGNIKGRLLLTEKDFVAVEGPEGEELPSVPKHWGEDQLAPGASFKKKGRSGGSSTPTPTPTPAPVAPVDAFPSYTDKPRPEGWESFSGEEKRAYIYADFTKTEPDAGAQVEEPAGNASREAWAEYAVKNKGAKPEDLLDGDGKELGRDELRTQYGTPTGS